MKDTTESIAHANFEIPESAYADDPVLLRENIVQSDSPPPARKTRREKSPIEHFGKVCGSGDWDKPYKWLVRNLIPDSSIGFIGGAAASGKTFFAIEVIGSVITGEPILGQLPVDRTGLVVYCSVEGKQGLSHRFEAYRQSRNIDKSIWENRLVQTVEHFRFTDTDDEHFIEFIQQIEKTHDVKVALVVFDTFRTFSGIADENGSGDAQAALNWMRRVAQKIGCSVMAIHHSGKSTDGNPIRPGDDFNRVLRGSSDFGCSAEFVIGVATGQNASGEDHPWVWPAKLKDAERLPPMAAPIDTHLLEIADFAPVSVGVIAKEIDSNLALNASLLNPRPGKPSKSEPEAKALANFILRSEKPVEISDIRAEHKRLCQEDKASDTAIPSRWKRCFAYLRENSEELEIFSLNSGEQFYKFAHFHTEVQ